MARHNESVGPQLPQLPELSRSATGGNTTCQGFCLTSAVGRAARNLQRQHHMNLASLPSESIVSSALSEVHLTLEMRMSFEWSNPGKPGANEANTGANFYRNFRCILPLCNDTSS